MSAATLTVNRRRSPRDLVNTSDIALFFWRSYRVRVKPATIRQWAVRGYLKTYGIRRERYDIREVVAFAQERGVIPRKAAGDSGGAENT